MSYAWLHCRTPFHPIPQRFCRLAAPRPADMNLDLAIIAVASIPCPRGVLQIVQCHHQTCRDSGAPLAFTEECSEHLFHGISQSTLAASFTRLCSGLIIRSSSIRNRCPWRSSTADLLGFTGLSNLQDFSSFPTETCRYYTIYITVYKVLSIRYGFFSGDYLRNMRVKGVFKPNMRTALPPRIRFISS